MSLSNCNASITKLSRSNLVAAQTLRDDQPPKYLHRELAPNGIEQWWSTFFPQQTRRAAPGLTTGWIVVPIECPGPAWQAPSGHTKGGKGQPGLSPGPWPDPNQDL